MLFNCGVTGAEIDAYPATELADLTAPFSDWSGHVQAMPARWMTEGSHWLRAFSSRGTGGSTVTYSALTPLIVSRVPGCRPLDGEEVPFEHSRLVR